jgi:hypothetical protein
MMDTVLVVIIRYVLLLIYSRASSVHKEYLETLSLEPGLSARRRRRRWRIATTCKDDGRPALAIGFAREALNLFRCG